MGFKESFCNLGVIPSSRAGWILNLVALAQIVAAIFVQSGSASFSPSAVHVTSVGAFPFGSMLYFVMPVVIYLVCGIFLKNIDIFKPIALNFILFFLLLVPNVFSYLNASLDRSEGKIQLAMISEKNEEKVKGKVLYQILVLPPEYRNLLVRIDLSKLEYENVSKGQAIYLKFRDGGFNRSWIESYSLKKVEHLAE